MNPCPQAIPTVAVRALSMPGTTADPLLAKASHSPLSTDRTLTDRTLTDRTLTDRTSKPVRSQAKPLIVRISEAEEAGGLDFQHHNADGTETWCYEKQNAEHPDARYTLTSCGIDVLRCDCPNLKLSCKGDCKHCGLLAFSLLYDLLARRGDIQPEALAGQTGSAEKRIDEKGGRQYWVRQRATRPAGRTCGDIMKCGAAAHSDLWRVFGAGGQLLCVSICELSCSECDWRLIQ